MVPFKNALPIWHPAGGSINQTIEFSSQFIVDQPEKVQFHIHVNTNYALYINDEFVDSGNFAEFEEDRAYDSISLRKMVTSGENRFTLYAYYQGEDSFSVRKYPPEALFCVTENDEEILFSDAGFPVRTVDQFIGDVPKISGQLSFSFEYDYRKGVSPLMPSVLVAEKIPRLRPRPISKLVIDEPVPVQVAVQGRYQPCSTADQSRPADIMQRAFRSLSRPFTPDHFPSEDGITFTDNDIILDTGRELVGYFMLDIDLPRPCEVLVGWGEHLEDCHVRTEIRGRNFAARLTLPKGNSIFFFPFKRMAFRYLELQVDLPESESFVLYYAGMRPCGYPLKKLNDFTCADHAHQEIYRKSVRTLLGCMHEHYEDCPWREQALYTMDSRNQMLTGYYTFEEYDFAKASLRLISHGLRDDGYLELINPGRASITIPSFTAIYLIQVAEYLKYTEDFQFIRELLPACRAIARAWVNKIDHTGLIPRDRDEKYWCFYEWQTGLDGHTGYTPDCTVYDAPLNAFVSLALSSMASIESKLGFPKEASADLNAVYRIKKAFHKTFFDEDKCYYRTFSSKEGKFHSAELTQALAVCADLVPDERLTEVLAALAYKADGPQDPKEPFYSVTLSHSIFKYEALLRQPKTYTRFVFDQIASLYGSMLQRNATTFWETIDGGDAFENAGSLCHGWSAIPAYFYLKYVLDIRKEGVRFTPEETGIYEARITPVNHPLHKIQYEY